METINLLYLSFEGDGFIPSISREKPENLEVNLSAGTWKQVERSGMIGRSPTVWPQEMAGLAQKKMFIGGVFDTTDDGHIGEMLSTVVTFLVRHMKHQSQRMMGHARLGGIRLPGSEYLDKT